MTYTTILNTYLANVVTNAFVYYNDLGVGTITLWIEFVPHGIFHIQSRVFHVSTGFFEEFYASKS